LTLRVELANSGNVPTTPPFSVTVRMDEITITDLTVTSLGGCGQVARSYFTLPNVPPGVHSVQMTVDSTAQVLETNEQDNLLSATILVGTHRVYLPVLKKSG